jgi:hypothetical protein
MPIIDPFAIPYEERGSLVAAWKALVYDKFLEGVGETENLDPFESVFYSGAFLKLEYQRVLNLPDAEGIVAVCEVLTTLFRSDFPTLFWKKFTHATVTTGLLPKYFLKGLDLYRSAVNDFLVLWVGMTTKTFIGVKPDFETEMCGVLSNTHLKLFPMRGLQKTYHEEMVQINRIPFSLEYAIDDSLASPVFNQVAKHLLAYRNLKPLIELTEELDVATGFCRSLKEKVVTFTKYTPPTSGDLLVLFYEAQRVINWYHYERFKNLTGDSPLTKLLSGIFVSHGKEIPMFINSQLSKMDSYCVTFPPAAFSQYCPTEPPIPSEYRFSETDIPCMICKDPVHVGVSAFCLNPECLAFNNQMKGLVHYACFTPIIWSSFYRDSVITWKLGSPPPNAPCPTCRDPIETEQIKSLLRTVVVLPPSVRKRLTPELPNRDAPVETLPPPPKKQKIIDIELPPTDDPSLWAVVTEDNRPALE